MDCLTDAERSSGGRDVLVEMERQTGLALTLDSSIVSSGRNRRKRKGDERQPASSATAVDNEEETTRERLIAKLSNKYIYYFK